MDLLVTKPNIISFFQLIALVGNMVRNLHKLYVLTF